MGMLYLLVVPTTLFVTVLGLLYVYLTWNFDYWRKRGVNGPKPKPLLGTFPGIVTNKRNFVYDLHEVYMKFKGKEKFVGVFTIVNPQILVLDPELAQEILVKNFRCFHDNEASKWVNKSVEPISGSNPFIATGETWKEKRSEIVPGLTSAKIKIDYPIIKTACSKLSSFIKEHEEDSQNGFDVNHLALKFTGEVVCDVVWGIEAGAFKQKDDCTFVDMATKTIQQSYYSLVFYFISQVLPIIRNLFSVRFFPKASDDFFLRFLSDAIALRSSSKIHRTDFLQYLITLQEKKHLSNTQLVGHQLTFLFDGFETSAIVISHCLLCLARNPDVQQQLRDEIMDNLAEDGFLTFENLNDLPYLENVFNENLRIFTPLAFMSKVCTEEYTLTNPKGNPVTLYPGNIVHISPHSFHMDEEYYPEPQKFNPDRFCTEYGGIKKYKEMGVFLPFGDGPRTCLGMKFGTAQAKAAVVEIIKKFQVTVHERTRKDNLCAPGTLILSLDGGIYLKFKSI